MEIIDKTKGYRIKEIVIDQVARETRLFNNLIKNWVPDVKIEIIP